MTNEETTADALLAAIRRMRAIAPGMTLLQAECFLMIAANPGSALLDIAKDVQTEPGKELTRAVERISERSFRNPQGIGLVEAKTNPENAKEQVFSLTAKGQGLMKELAGAKDNY